MELTSPHENINTYLYAKQFSLKTDWKLAEGFLYSQGCKKDAHVIWAEREETEFKDIDGLKCVCVCVCTYTHTQRTWVRSQGREDSLEEKDPLEKMATTPVSLPGKYHRQRSRVGYSPWGHGELDMSE